MPAGSMIDRVLDMLDLLADYPTGLPVSEIARRLNASKSETFRVLTVMMKRDFVSQDRETQRYRLSVRTAALALRFFGSSGLIEVCQPILDRLAARTGELVRLAIVEHGELYFIANAQGALGGIRFDPDMGRKPASLNGTANGRAWLATLDPQEAEDVVTERGFTVPQLPLKTSVTDTSSLRIALAAVRDNGFATSFEETIEGLVTVAAAIERRSGGPAVGCVSFAGPIFRLSNQKIAEFVPDLKAAASQIGSIWPVKPQYLDIDI